MAKSKPVHEVSAGQMEDYEFAASRAGGGKPEFLASDSLGNLKREVRNRGWRMAWISVRTGCLSYGQTLSDEIPYQPKPAEEGGKS